ncbi:MAG: TIGR00303 family protein [Synechococcales cyanobacterium]
MAPGVWAVHGYGQAVGFWRSLAGRDPLLVLTVATTDTANHPGLSAAGADPQKRLTTAAADAEFLILGRTLSQPGIPTHPLGIPSPVIISRAMGGLIPSLQVRCVDAGSRVAPQVPDLVRLGTAVAQSVETGHALDRTNVESLWHQATQWGQELGQFCQDHQRYLILGESVPGGTTTALAVLMALGLDAEYRVSSSLAGGATPAKLALITQGLGSKGQWRRDPLGAVAAVGDPMQPVVAGLALAASHHCPVLLGGGTQMMAVLAVIMALGDPGSLAVGMTGWVARDEAADVAGLAMLCQEQWGGRGIPHFAVDLDFGSSRWSDLHPYEQGYVKEGVAAGALTLAACRYLGQHPQSFLPAIEQVYEQSRSRSGIPT